MSLENISEKKLFYGKRGCRCLLKEISIYFGGIQCKKKDIKSKREEKCKKIYFLFNPY